MLSVAMAEAIVAGGQRGGLTLTVLYDERCPLCRRLRRWLGEQPTLSSIRFVAADSPVARRRFPGLDHQRTTRMLTVVASDGAVYEGERAWLMCAWVLPSWQPIAEHFATGWRLRMARVGARVVDSYRHRFVMPDGGQACERCSIAAPAQGGPRGRRPPRAPRRGPEAGSWRA
jgi:predicted DCC family thiol-disulfide oxidoreductase YuxK